MTKPHPTRTIRALREQRATNLRLIQEQGASLACCRRDLERLTKHHEREREALIYGLACSMLRHQGVQDDRLYSAVESLRWLLHVAEEV